MKTLANLTMFALLLLAFLNSCVEQNTVNSDPARLNFTVLSLENEPLNEFPPGTSLTINLESGDGANFIALANQEFVRSANGFTTSALNVPDGTYKITDVILLNENDEIIYAIPKINTTLASKTTAALPVLLTESLSTGSGLSLIDVQNRIPMDFGYESFKNPNHVLKLTVTVKGSQKAVSATAYLMSGLDTLQTYAIKAGQTQVSIPVSNSPDYRLLIAKEGYANYSIDLTSGATKDIYKKPLKVILQPAFSMLAYVDSDIPDNFSFSLGVLEGSSLSINWGDGSPAEMFSGGEVYHYYPPVGNFPVVVTGDLDKINSFYSFYGQGMVDAIDFRHLTSMVDIAFGLTRSPAVIDLSYNSKLYFLNMTGLENTQRIILPENHVIQYVAIDGPNMMTTETVDAFIENLYNNSVRNNIRDG